MKFPLLRNWRFIAGFLLILGLLLLSLSGYFSPVFRVTVNPLVSAQRWISERYLAIYDFLTVPRDVERLRQRNAKLEIEVLRLQTQIIELQQQLRETEVLYALLDFARTSPESRYVAATVIGHDTSPFLRYIFLDQGSDDGLRHGMPVVSEQGLVGRIDAVHATASRVQLITDPGSTLSVRILLAQVDAVMVGSVTGEISIEMLPKDAAVNPGDLVLTSGLGGDYPPEVVIGQVLATRMQENGLFQSASVQPAVDFANMRAVLVILNFRPVDISPLIPTPSQ